MYFNGGTMTANFAGLAVPPLRVAVAQNEDGTYNADHTLAQILDAYDNGNAVYCQYGNLVLSLEMISNAFCSFACVLSGNVHTVQIGLSSVTVTTTPVVKTVNGTAPDENGNVVLDIQSGGDGWTLLYNETTSEVVSSICATLDGSYTEFIAYLETAYDENVTKLLNLSINGDYVSEGGVNRNSVRKNIFHVITSPKNGFVKCDAAYQCAGFGNSAASSVGFARNVKFSDTVTIDAVTRGDAGTTGKIFAVGTTFTVWGRK